MQDDNQAAYYKPVAGDEHYAPLIAMLEKEGELAKKAYLQEIEPSAAYPSVTLTSIGNIKRLITGERIENEISGDTLRNAVMQLYYAEMQERNLPAEAQLEELNAVQKAAQVAWRRKAWEIDNAVNTNVLDEDHAFEKLKDNRIRFEILDEKIADTKELLLEEIRMNNNAQSAPDEVKPYAQALANDVHEKRMQKQLHLREFIKDTIGEIISEPPNAIRENIPDFDHPTHEERYWNMTMAEVTGSNHGLPAKPAKGAELS